MVSSNFVQFAVLNSDGMLYRFSADGLIMVIMVWLTSRDCLAQSCNDSLSYILYNIWTSCGELLEVFSPFFFGSLIMLDLMSRIWHHYAQKFLIIFLVQILRNQV